MGHYIDWKKEKKDKLLVELADPSHKGPWPKVAISYLFEKFIKEYPFVNKKAKLVWKCHANKFLGDTDPKRNISTITVGDFGDLSGEYRMQRVSAIMRSIKWQLNPTLLRGMSDTVQSSTNGHINIKTRIKAGTVDMLEDLMMSQSFSKHAEMITAVRDAIAECPPNEIRIIEGTKEIVENKKLRASIFNSVRKSLAPLGWTIRWSTARKVFFVAREEQIERFKKERKNK